MTYARRAARFVRTLARPERKKILDTIGEHRDGFRDFAIVTFALETGCRETEIAALDVGDVAAGKEIRPRVELRVFANKGRKPAKGAPRPKTQRVFLGRQVRKVLAKFLAWKKREGEPLEAAAPLFCAGVSSHSGERGARISDRTIRHMWRTWQTRAKISPPLFTFHELRHTFATELYARTKSLLHVQKALRHKDVTSTEIYAQVSDEQLARALEEPLA